MKLAQKNKSRISELVTLINNGAISAQGPKNKRHGKALEIMLAEEYNFRNEDGSLYEQYGNKIDFPKEIVSKGNVPKEWIGDWEVKYYSSTTNQILFGDLEKKMESIRKGMILVLGIYEGDPRNIVDLMFIRIKNTKELRENLSTWKEVCSAVKNANTSIDDGRELVKFVNKNTKGSFKLSNISRHERWSESKQEWQGEARAVQLTCSMKHILSLRK